MGRPLRFAFGGRLLLHGGLRLGLGVVLELELVGCRNVGQIPTGRLHQEPDSCGQYDGGLRERLALAVRRQRHRIEFQILVCHNGFDTESVSTNALQECLVIANRPSLWNLLNTFSFGLHFSQHPPLLDDLQFPNRTPGLLDLRVHMLPIQRHQSARLQNRRQVLLAGLLALELLLLRAMKQPRLVHQRVDMLLKIVVRRCRGHRLATETRPGVAPGVSGLEGPVDQHLLLFGSGRDPRLPCVCQWLCCADRILVGCRARRLCRWPVPLPRRVRSPGFHRHRCRVARQQPCYVRA
mmetsp:Transcript_49778/g.83389  ORF Transcript_49778/g.83389 Transcript_49778/m.83389 type:complete len:295 (-) Transcript_49778:653-1537(-)